MRKIIGFTIVVLALITLGCASNPYTKPDRPKNPNWWKFQNSSTLFPFPPGSNAEEKTVEGEESNYDTRNAPYMEAVKQPDDTYKMEWRNTIKENK